jgi:benzaldehyde dehydrogenase (NAD)
VSIVEPAATQECYEAAALAHRPAGEILQGNQLRLSLLRRGGG